MTQAVLSSRALDEGRRFCSEFLEHPYLCYTEHGLHALFFSRLLMALPEPERYATWRGERFCVVQKEYPTASPLGKPKRQHWDIALVKSPPTSLREEHSFDFLRLALVFEFGMNASRGHLREDVRRVTHSEANLDHGVVFHFHRLSPPGCGFSGRDCSVDSSAICTLQEAESIQAKSEATVLYVMADPTEHFLRGAWEITAKGTRRLA